MSPKERGKRGRGRRGREGPRLFLLPEQHGGLQQQVVTDETGRGEKGKGREGKDIDFLQHALLLLFTLPPPRGPPCSGSNKGLFSSKPWSRGRRKKEGRKEAKILMNKPSPTAKGEMKGEIKNLVLVGQKITPRATARRDLRGRLPHERRRPGPGKREEEGTTVFVLRSPPDIVGRFPSHE